MKINEARELSEKILLKLGFRRVECVLITQNLIEAELVERKTHGLLGFWKFLIWLKAEILKLLTKISK